MRVLFFVLLVIFYFQGKAQNVFFKWFDTPDHEVAYDAVQTAQGEFIIAGEKGIDANQLNSYILKISADGYILDEKEMPNPSGNSRIRTIDKLPGPDNRFLITGARDSVTDNATYSRLFLMVINDSLEIISSKEYSLHKNRVFNPWKTVILSDSSFYLLCSFDSIHNGQFDYDLIVTKFNIPFDSLCSFYHEEDLTYYLPQDIYFKSKDKTVQVFYFGSTMSDSSPPIKILTLSENLEFISLDYGPQYLRANVSASPLNDSITYVTGANFIYLPPFDSDIGCYLLNDTNGVVKFAEFYNDPDTLLYGGRGGYSLLTNSETSKTFITSHYNLDLESYPWPIDPTWIQITRTDFDLNIIDHHFYGGDAAYVALSMKATADGGAFLTGFRYDYNSQGSYQYDVFILKTDSAGTIVNIPEINIGSLSEAILTPTPGSDYVFAIVGEQYSSAKLQLCDLYGRKILETTVYGYRTKINTTSLSGGIYTYSFTAGGKVIGHGKWIKK
jgi:hypothetical protein